MPGPLNAEHIFWGLGGTKELSRIRVTQNELSRPGLGPATALSHSQSQWPFVLFSRPNFCYFIIATVAAFSSRPAQWPAALSQSFSFVVRLAFIIIIIFLLFLLCAVLFNRRTDQTGASWRQRRRRRLARLAKKVRRQLVVGPTPEWVEIMRLSGQKKRGAGTGTGARGSHIKEATETQLNSKANAFIFHEI